MDALLKELLPRIFPNVTFQYIPHEGKQDLEKSIPRKLRGWREPDVCFVVMRDNDGQDCVALKERLRELCTSGGREDTLIRIVCQELEAWYFGEPDALAEAYGRDNLRNIGRRRGFRDSDSIQNPSQRLENIVPEFRKGTTSARRMGQCLTKERNKSTSFQVLLTGLERLIQLDGDRSEQFGASSHQYQLKIL